LLELNLDNSLEERRRLADMVTVQKIIHGHGDLDPEQWFDKFSCERMTRAASDPRNVKSKGGRLDIRTGFFANRVVRDWNEIPGEITNIHETKKFKTAYTRWKKSREPHREQQRI
jgi:hypothetical protein